ncbi:MAG: serine/threonine protein kinase [Bifidobacteriaceae bacterium]|jgi:hypothetical protein|nr:serine/threonine protein kinase [Bifidobacteriaceae bacterium]
MSAGHPPERDRPAPTIFESLASTPKAAQPATAFETGGAAGSGSGIVGGGGWMRTNLPPELLERYQPERTLNVSAGQADLVVCRERSSGAEVVIKLYRYSDQLDRGVLARLYQAEPQHVVRLLDHGESHGVPWEVQEYCPNGTLADLRTRAGGRIAVERMPHIVRELAEALHHIHGLGITHRDLKPQNVLVRALTPEPDLVLTDFGVAREQFELTQFTTIKATFAWAAPEVHEGVQKAPVDWWALGAIIYELLAGRHLLADSSGLLLPDVQIRPIVMRGLYTTEALGIGSGSGLPRWRNLVDGLLAQDPAGRWGHDQVSAWLEGRDPPVQRTRPLGGASGGASGMIGRARPTALAGVKFVFNGHPVASGRELVAAMRRDWAAAEALLAGQAGALGGGQVGGPIDPALEQWLEASAEGARAVEELRLESCAGARFVRLQAALDPGSPVEFRGLVLDDATLGRGIVLAGGWQPGGGADGPTGAAVDGSIDPERAVNWLLAVRDQRVLRALASLRATERVLGERLGMADLRLDEWREQVRQVRQSVPDSKLEALVGVREKALIGQFFSIALGAQDGEPLVAALRQSIKQRDTAGAFWLEGLVAGPSNAPLGAPLGAPGGSGGSSGSSGSGGSGSPGPTAAASMAGPLGRLAAVAVLTEAVSVDNALRTRQETARREAQEQTARAEMEQTELEMQAARRGHITSQLMAQLRWRAFVALVYAALGGWALSSGGRLTGSWPIESLTVLGFALVAVALITAVDWMLENPAGRLRGAVVSAGLVAAGAFWVTTMSGSYVERTHVWAAPLVVAAGWIIGDLLSSWLRHMTAGRPTTILADRGQPNERSVDIARRVSAAFRRAALARSWSWVFVIAALLTALSGLFYDACGSACSASHREVFDYSLAQSVLPLDVLGLPSHPWVLAVVALLAWLAQLASKPLMRVYWGPGWIPYWIGLVLALLVLATGPDSPVAWLAGWITGLTA